MSQKSQIFFSNEPKWFKLSSDQNASPKKNCSYKKIPEITYYLVLMSNYIFNWYLKCWVCVKIGQSPIKRPNVKRASHNLFSIVVFISYFEIFTSLCITRKNSAQISSAQLCLKCSLIMFRAQQQQAQLIEYNNKPSNIANNGFIIVQ